MENSILVSPIFLIKHIRRFNTVIKEPVMDCTDEEVVELGKEWQTRLFLDNWIIHFQFQKESLFDDQGRELEGQCSFCVDNSSAVITLLKPNDDTKDRIVKHCVEHVLVHELLHCKMNFMNPPNTLEGKYYDVKEHALLEELSKSLIMAKYNLPFSWFKNF